MIHIDQEPIPVPDLAPVLQGVTERDPGPSQDLDPHREDEVVDEIALEEMAEEDVEALATAVIAVMMLGVEAEAGIVEGGEGDRRLRVEMYQNTA